MNNTKSKGFTIVELLVVIIIIGILATIATVSYSSIQTQVKAASLTSDLYTASSRLKLYHFNHGTYPTGLDSNNCPLGSDPSPDTSYCLEPSSGNTIAYSTINQQTFRLASTNGTTSYSVTDTTSPTEATTDASCPSGFIPIPGSGTYKTSDFCVMKYEAKADDNGDGIGDTNHTMSYGTWDIPTYPISATRKLVSTAAGSPVANISQTAALTAAASYTAGCDTGCHLITEAEWMTIVQNALSVPSNWSGGSVDSGFVYNGHNDNNPTKAIEADTSVSGDDGYVNTLNSSPSGQRRTLNLTNGYAIWDIAGNIYEWTQGTIASGQQPGIPGESSFQWKEWNNVLLDMNGLPAESQPSTTGITGSEGWGSSRGIGLLCSNHGETSTRAFMRGGQWTTGGGTGGGAGILSLCLEPTSDDVSTAIGMRVVRSN